MKSNKQEGALSRKQREILADLLSGDGTGQPGVDVRRYRARNPRIWSDLEELERLYFIKQDNNRYLTSLLALVRMQTPFARAFRKDTEKVYAHFRREYSRDQNAKITMDELSRVTSLPVAHVAVVVRHMLEASIWGGHNLSHDASAAAYVIPGEKVVSVSFPHFRDVVAEMESQRAANARHRGHYSGSISVSAADIVSSDAVIASRSRPTPPAWHDRLDPTLRELMRQIAVAIEDEACMLATMGLRAAIDFAFTDKIKTADTFAKKLILLAKEGHITEAQRIVLSNAIELGHAASHRGYAADRDEVVALLDIVEHLLKQFYVHGPESERLRSKVPPRPPRH